MVVLTDNIYLLEQKDEDMDFSSQDGKIVDPTVIVLYIDKMKLSKFKNTQCINPIHVDCTEKKSKLLKKCSIVFDGSDEDFSKCFPNLIRYVENVQKE